jgi:subtilase family serine protease
VTAPSTGIIGDSIEMSVKVKNQGEATAGTHKLRIYFSSDATITSSDSYTGRACTFDGSTDVDETRTCSGYISIPTDLTPGTYYLGGIADAEGEVEESDESNNTRASGAIEISDPPPTALPDLAMVAITIPGTGSIGDSITVELTIQNHGEAASGAFRAGVYFSTDQTLTTTDTYSGAFCSFQGLSVGGTAGCEGPVGVPESLAPGVYFVGGIADDGNTVEETDETNNDLAGEITLSIPASGPDLIVTSLTAPATGVIGDSIYVEATLENQGDQDAGAFRFGLYYSTDDEISSDDELAFVFVTPSSPLTADRFSGAGCGFESGLGAGEAGSCSGFIPVPDDLTPGTYYLGAIADDLNEVVESDEENNTRASGPITISVTGGPLPDLTVLEFTAPTSGTIGGTATVSMRVGNLGSVAAGAFRVGIYFSTDQTITPGTDTVSPTFCVWDQGLSAGGAGNCSGAIDIPTGLSPGTYYVGVYADDGFAVAESSESNNSRNSSTTIVLTY